MKIEVVEYTCMILRNWLVGTEPIVSERLIDTHGWLP